MLATIIVALAVVFLARALRSEAAAATPTLAAPPVSPQLASTITYADRLYAEKRWLAAEKAYLDVLKLDHKNLTAYSHLGIIYTTQKNYADAIECFELAVRFRPTAATHQNLAMAYYENKNYIKAIAMFEKAIMFEPSAGRYIGLSKAYKKINNTPHMLTALEQAAAIDPSIRVLELLAKAYAEAGRLDDYRAVRDRSRLQTGAGSAGEAAGIAPAQP